MFLSRGHGIHREKITAVASALFTEKGIAATTVDEIAKKRGTVKPLLISDLYQISVVLFIYW